MALNPKRHRVPSLRDMERTRPGALNPMLHDQVRNAHQADLVAWAGKRVARPLAPGAAALAINVVAWNLVKSDDADTVFDVTEGTHGPAKKDVDAGVTHEMFLRFDRVMPSGKQGMLHLEMGDIEQELGASPAAASGYVSFSEVHESWDPSTLTWNNRPTSLSTMADWLIYGAGSNVTNTWNPADASSAFQAESIFELSPGANCFGVKIGFQFLPFDPADTILRVVEVLNARVTF